MGRIERIAEEVFSLINNTNFIIGVFLNHIDCLNCLKCLEVKRFTPAEWNACIGDVIAFDSVKTRNYYTDWDEDEAVENIAEQIEEKLYKKLTELLLEEWEEQAEEKNFPITRDFIEFLKEKAEEVADDLIEEIDRDKDGCARIPDLVIEDGIVAYIEEYAEDASDIFIFTLPPEETPIIQAIDKAIEEIDPKATYEIKANIDGYSNGEPACYSRVAGLLGGLYYIGPMCIPGEVGEEVEYDEDEGLQVRKRVSGEFVKGMLEGLREGLLDDFYAFQERCCSDCDDEKMRIECLKGALKKLFGKPVSVSYKSMSNPYAYCEERIEFEGDGEEGYCEMEYIHPCEVNVSFEACTTESFSYRKIHKEVLQNA